MERRFEVRRAELLEGARIDRKVYEGVLERLPGFLEPYMDVLVRSEQRGHMRRYLEGLMSDLKRKNVESIAYLHDQGRRELQRFVGESGWKYEPIQDRLTQDVGRELGEEDGVMVFDPSGFEKDGEDSVGVQRQWLGRVGKVDNGQVGVYLGYATRKGHALCQVRLFLPKEWARDRERRKKCGVPKEVRFRTRHELAEEMLERCGSWLPHRWVAGDDEMGRSTRFRGRLRERGERYVLAVPSNTSMRDLEVEPPKWSGQGARPKAPWTSVRKWAKALPSSAWKRIDVRDGEKGPLVVKAVMCRVQTRDAGRHVGPEELLVVTRIKESKGWRTDYHLSNAPADTPLEELCRVVKAGHRIEDCFQRAKGEAGLADYEVRTWIGWHHHQVLSMLAAWFLTREVMRGEKADAGADRADDAFADRADVA
jgi:SRSO17 transposase